MNYHQKQNAKLERASSFRNLLLVISILYTLGVTIVVFFLGKEYVQTIYYLWPYAFISFAISLIAINFSRYAAYLLILLAITAESICIYIIYKFGFENYWIPNFGISLLIASNIMVIGLASEKTLLKKLLLDRKKTKSNTEQPSSDVGLKIIRRIRRRKYIRSRLSTKVKPSRYR